MEKISVAVRFRPSSGQETAEDRQWRIEDNRISLHRPLGTPISGVSFAFGTFFNSFGRNPNPSSITKSSFFSICFSDHVFDQTTRNAEVYDRLTKPIIEAAVGGFNGENGNFPRLFMITGSDLLFVSPFSPRF